MEPETVVTHPDAVVLFRNGTLVGGRLCGSVPHVRLAEGDLALFSAFLGGADPRAMAAQISSSPADLYLSRAPTPREVLGWVAGMGRRGFLAPAPARPPRAQPLRPADCPAAPSVPKGRAYRLTANFMLRLVPGGFEIWCPRTGRSHVLGLELALLLVSFGTGKTVNKVVRERMLLGTAESRRRAVQWFVQEGMIIPARSEAEVAAGAPPGFTPEVREQDTAGRDWRSIEPDGRIPVYFVPHMENHYPLALGMIYSALEAYDGGSLAQRFQLLPITYLGAEQFLAGPYRKFGPGVWLFSNYMWSVKQNLRVCEAVKSRDPRNLTIHGGPSTPAYEKACSDFMKKYPSVDISVHGEGEVTAAQLFERLFRRDDGAVAFEDGALAEVAGLTFRGRQTGELVRTLPRVRMRDLDVIPSPYTEGVFDRYAGQVDAAIVETNRGCPFACTFCDWGSATNGKVAKFDMDRVKAEIEWVGRNRVRVLWIADANFGMLKRDLEIAECIVDVKSRYGFPQEVVVNYTKNATRKLADIIQVFSAGQIVSQGIISIQTTDEQTLDVINRQNIRTDKYDELIEVFDEAGLPLSTDLMIGLPGITVEAFDRDLQRYIDVDVQVKAYPTQLLPNSPMADPEYMEKYEIQADENDYLVSCYSYTRQDLNEMKAIYKVYVATEGYGALRYVMRFLQWEHGIQAVRFMRDLIAYARADVSRAPAITWVLRHFNSLKCMPGGWRRFYDEIGVFVRERYGVERDSALNTVLRVNELAMPDECIEYPASARLEHDFVAYFREHNVRVGRSTGVRPLSTYPPGELRVDDPDRMASINVEYQQYDTHQYFWELRSPVARAQSAADLKAERPSFTGQPRSPDRPGAAP